MHRSTLAKLCVAATAGTIMLATNLPTATAQPASAAPAAKTTPTKYMVSSLGYASRVVGGDLPTNSGKTAFQVISCTNLAGIDRTNTKADLALPGGINLSGLKTRTWTTKRGATVSSYSRHSIAKVVVADTAVGSLFIEAVTSTSRAWHNAAGYHSSAVSNVGDLVFDPIAGPPIQVALPLPGKTITIAGIVRLSLGAGTERAGATGASAELDAIKLSVIPTQTTVYLAHSRAAIDGRLPKALYRGSAFGIKADVAEGVLTSQREPNVITPCRGSNGVVRANADVEVDVTTGVRATVLDATTRSGLNAKGQPFVKNTAKVARVALGHGLVVSAIEARAAITKVGARYVKSAQGTTLARIVLNGQRLVLPKTGVLRLPGIARIESNIVHRARTSIAVTALRVTLLDGRLATVDIGFAKAGLIPTR